MITVIPLPYSMMNRMLSDQNIPDGSKLLNQGQTKRQRGVKPEPIIDNETEN